MNKKRLFMISKSAKTIFLSIVFTLLIALSAYGYEIKDYTDVPKDHWAYTNIMDMSNRGIFKGAGDGKFLPNKTISVAEFTVALVRISGYELSSDATTWYSPYVYAAKSNGIILESDGFEDYNRNITRGEMVRMVNRYNKQLGEFDDMPEYIRILYIMLLRDYAYVPVDLREDVLNAFISGVLTGNNDGYIDANGNATRAEASTILLRLIDKSIRNVPNLDDLGYKDNVNIYFNSNRNRVRGNFSTGDIWIYEDFRIVKYKWRIDGSDYQEVSKEELEKSDGYSFFELSFPIGKGYIDFVQGLNNMRFYTDTKTDKDVFITIGNFYGKVDNVQKGIVDYPLPYAENNKHYFLDTHTGTSRKISDTTDMRSIVTEHYIYFFYKGEGWRVDRNGKNPINTKIGEDMMFVKDNKIYGYYQIYNEDGSVYGSHKWVEEFDDGKFNHIFSVGLTPLIIDGYQYDIVINRHIPLWDKSAKMYLIKYDPITHKVVKYTKLDASRLQCLDNLKYANGRLYFQAIMPGASYESETIIYSLNLEGNDLKRHMNKAAYFHRYLPAPDGSLMVLNKESGALYNSSGNEVNSFYYGGKFQSVEVFGLWYEDGEFKFYIRGKEDGKWNKYIYRYTPNNELIFEKTDLSPYHFSDSEMWNY